MREEKKVDRRRMEKVPSEKAFPSPLDFLHSPALFASGEWRGQDLNLRPRGYEPRELPDCSTPRHEASGDVFHRRSKDGL